MHSVYLHSAHVAGFAASRPSSGDVVAAALVGATYLLAFALTVIVAVAAARHDHIDESEGDSGSDGGGGGGGEGGRGGPNRPGPLPDDPVWWPEFERQFADYVTAPIRR